MFNLYYIDSLNENKTESITSKNKDKPPQQNDSYAKLLESIYLDNKPNEDCFTKLKIELDQKQDTEKDDSDDWLCVEAPQLDDYLEMYSRGDVSSTYDFSMISNAFKRFLEVPKAKKDLLEGVDYNSIDKKTENSEQLVDFDIELIEKNLQDLLSKPDKALPEINEDDDENDSFYEIDDELLNDNLKNDNDQLQNNLKSYMGSMDAELKDIKNISRLETKENEELDLDLNLVSNALESYSSQLGYTGPVSNILKSLGL